MPISIPTYFALKFVREHNLMTRMYILRNSIFTRYGVFGSLLCATNQKSNIDSFTLCHKFLLNSYI